MSAVNSNKIRLFYVLLVRFPLSGILGGCFYQTSNTNMTSMASDCESNVSGWVVHCSDRTISQMYLAVIEGMESINQDLLLIANNMKSIVSQAGPLESQLSALLRALPDPSLHLNMETE